jgi:hypothetical protein
MAQDELVEKIQRLLERPLTKEMQVVYLLVELRKLMERAAYDDPVLKMFCNWVVHTNLGNKAPGATLLLKDFDDHFTQLFEHERLLPNAGHISGRAFREALGQCLRRFNIAANFLHDLKKLKTFFSLYASIVSECPIVYTASRAQLKYVQKIEIVGVSKGIIVKEWPVIDWRITMHDGSTQNWGFHLG